MDKENLKENSEEPGYFIRYNNKSTEWKTVWGSFPDGDKLSTPHGAYRGHFPRYKSGRGIADHPPRSRAAVRKSAAVPSFPQVFIA
jgi:hypothetical protein